MTNSKSDDLSTSIGQRNSNWQLVVHGGAGRKASEWSDETRIARKRGMENALKAGSKVLACNGSALDAVEAAIRVMEDDASFNAGRGSVLTDDHRVEMDASIMDGKTLGCGAVAGLTGTKNPIELARLVMTETPHVMLVGAGADAFANQQNVTQVSSDYFSGRFDNTYRPQPAESDDPHFGTVGCVARDTHGNLAAGTSTGGTHQKLPGRVGDSPIIGAGTYAANDTCGVSCTGVGEEFIRGSIAYDLAARLRYANEPIGRAIDQIVNHQLAAGMGGLIAISRDGEIVFCHNTPSMCCGSADGNGHFETRFQQ